MERFWGLVGFKKPEGDNSIFYSPELDEIFLFGSQGEYWTYTDHGKTMLHYIGEL